MSKLNIDQKTIKSLLQDNKADFLPHKVKTKRNEDILNAFADFLEANGLVQ